MQSYRSESKFKIMRMNFLFEQFNLPLELEASLKFKAIKFNCLSLCLARLACWPTQSLALRAPVAGKNQKQNFYFFLIKTKRQLFCFVLSYHNFF